MYNYSVFKLIEYNFFCRCKPFCKTILAIKYSQGYSKEILVLSGKSIPDHSGPFESFRIHSGCSGFLAQSMRRAIYNLLARVLHLNLSAPTSV